VAVGVNDNMTAEQAKRPEGAGDGAGVRPVHWAVSTLGLRRRYGGVEWG